MKFQAILLILGVLSSSAAFSHDNGPQMVGCDYKLGATEGTDKCLIVGSGTNQGISWVVFEVKGKRFRYSDDSPSSIEKIDKSGKIVKNYSVRNLHEQCRPGARSTDVYAFSNGDRICLYW